MIPISKQNPTCRSCSLSSAGASRFISPSGQGTIPLLVLTDQPVPREQNDRLEEGGGRSLSPRSPAGHTFTKACSKLGIKRDQVWMWSMLKCLPPEGKDRSYELGALTQCHNHLVSFVDEFKPQAILALGDMPIRWLTGYSGKKQGHMNLRGYILDNQRFPSIPVVAGIDPAHIVNVGKPILRRALAKDLEKAITLAKAGGRFNRPNEDRYELFPPLDRLREMYNYLKANPDSPIYYDIETHESFLADEQDLRAGRYGEVYKITTNENDLDPGMDSGDDLPWDDSEVPEQAELLTSKSIITQIQFACDIPDWAIAMVWAPEVAAITRDIFALPNLRVNVNRRVFDDPILRHSGVPLSDRGLDLMDLWHRYEPDLPKSLGFITPFFWPTVQPWKHLSQSEPGVYGCRDVISLQKIHRPLVAASDKVGIWTSFQVHDMQLGPALDRTQERGYPCDAQRKDHFGSVLQRYIRILRGRMTGLYPQDLLPYDKTAGPYEDRPVRLKKDYTEDNLYQTLIQVEEVHKIAELRTRKGKTPPPEAIELAGQYIDRIPPDLISWFKVKDTKAGRQIQALRWVYRKNFNPQSRDQILTYLEAKCEEEWQSFVAKDLTFQAQHPGLTLKQAEQKDKFPAPRGWKTNHIWFIPPNPKERTFKPWVSAKGLKRLTRALGSARISDPLIPLLIKTSAHARMYSSFVKTWRPSTENLVHTTFKFSPATPQLASVNPNILADPKHGSLAKWWRWVKKAHAGKRWISFDFGGFHAITTGFLANDPSYIYAARIDIHGILGYINEKLPHWDRLIKGLNDPAAMSRDELATLVKGARTSAPLMHGMTFKERRDEIYKRTILGVQLGMGAYTMYMNSPEAFGSKAYAQSLIDVEKSIWPKVFAFQDEQRALADRPNGFSIDAYGYLRRFEEVTRWEWSDEMGRSVSKPGPDSEKAIAAKVQGIAFGFIRDGLIWLDKERCPLTGMTWADKFGLVNNVHDSYEFHCPVEYTEECLAVVGKLLQRRSQILVGPAAPEGLWCAVEASVGIPGEGADTQQDVKIPIGPFDFPIEAQVGWPQFQA